MISKTDKISMIIPTYNKASRLRITLHYIKQIEDRERVNLIIINDGSTDQTKDVLEEFTHSLSEISFNNIEIIHSSNQGRATARNIGISKSEDELLLFMDDDIIPSPGIIRSHFNLYKKNVNSVIHGKIYDLSYLKFFSDPYKGEVSSNIQIKQLKKMVLPMCDSYDELFMKYLKDNRRTSKMEKKIYSLFFEEKNKGNQWLSCVGGNLFINRKQIVQCGGFDENFGKLWGCEDLELGYRLHLQGTEFKYNNDAEIYHMTHYRESAKDEHMTTLSYFMQKHIDSDLNILQNYFRDVIK